MFEKGLTIQSICELLGYRQKFCRVAWRQTKWHEKVETVVFEMEKIRTEMPRLGCRNVYHILYERKRSVNVGRAKEFTILKANGTLIKPCRPYRITTDFHYRSHKHKNLVEKIGMNEPEQVWVSDITNVGCGTVARIWHLLPMLIQRK